MAEIDKALPNTREKVKVNPEEDLELPIGICNDCKQEN